MFKPTRPKMFLFWRTRLEMAMFRPNRRSKMCSTLFEPSVLCFGRLDWKKLCSTVFDPSVLSFDHFDPNWLCFDQLGRRKMCLTVFVPSVLNCDQLEPNWLFLPLNRRKMCSTDSTKAFCFSPFWPKPGRILSSEFLFDPSVLCFDGFDKNWLCFDQICFQNLCHLCNSKNDHHQLVN